MKSVIVRYEEDLAKVDADVREIEFYEYSGFYDISNLKLNSVSYTKMDVDIDSIPSNVSSLSFFDCDFSISLLNKFKELVSLEITNRYIDILEISHLSNLKSINLNFCKILNVEEIVNFSFLEEISLIDTNVSNFNFLDDIKNLKTIVIDDNIYENNKNFFRKLGDKGIFILDMMGGAFNDIWF